jgi:hypothetical protein
MPGLIGGARGAGKSDEGEQRQRPQHRFALHLILRSREAASRRMAKGSVFAHPFETRLRRSSG